MSALVYMFIYEVDLQIFCSRVLLRMIFDSVFVPFSKIISLEVGYLCFGD